MILSKKQEEGLRIAVARHRAREPWTCISGYAGSGKTTLVSFIIAALGLCPEDVAYIASLGMDHIRVGFDQIVLEESPYIYREKIFQILHVTGECMQRIILIWLEIK